MRGHYKGYYNGYKVKDPYEQQNEALNPKKSQE